MYAEKRAKLNVINKNIFNAPNLQARQDLNKNLRNRYLEKETINADQQMQQSEQVFNMVSKVPVLKAKKKKSASESSDSELDLKKKIVIEEHPLWNSFENQHIPTKLSDDSKIQFIRIIASSLVSGALVKNPILLERSGLMILFDLCATYDPEFIFKSLLYCRRELYIRSTSNYLFAMAAMKPSCREYLWKYYSPLIMLPSDWLDIIKTFQKESKKSVKALSLPAALRKVMIEKFSEFKEYQLAKYNDVNLVKRRERKIRKDNLKPKCQNDLVPSSKTSDGSSIKSSLECDEQDGFEERTEELKFKREYSCLYDMRLPSCKLMDCDDSGDSSTADLEIESKRCEEEPLMFADDVNTKDEMKRIAYESLNMKKIIQYLHISRPHEYVMGILGKRYPANIDEFNKSGLEGYWDPTRAGTRMKLAIPFTWETELSMKGNNKKVWENIIDSGKLPYMACLRNLRNICLAGVSPEHMETVVKLITAKKNVINSKLFPMRFFTARVSLELLISKMKYIQGLSNRIKRTQNDEERIKLRSIIRSNAKLEEVSYHMIRTFISAVNKAFQICIHHNLPPISGRTLVIVNEDRREKIWLKNLEEVQKIILSTMCIYACEDVDAISIATSSEGLYQNLNTMVDSHHEGESMLDSVIANYCNKIDEKRSSVEELFSKIISEHRRYDNVIVFGQPTQDVIRFVDTFRKLVNPIFAIANPNKSLEKLDNWLTIIGHSDDVVRFLAEKGDEKTLRRIENLDKIYCKDFQNRSKDKGLPISHPDSINQQVLSRPAISAMETFAETNCFEQKSLRVFLSSTFMDMNGERDLLCGVVMPGLRKKLHKSDLSYIQVNELDLRWGVPEAAVQTPSSLQICLEFASKADIFVLLVGARYGWIPNKEHVEALDDKLYEQVNRFYQPGMSITEMEFRIAYNSIEDRLKKVFTLDEVDKEMKKRIFICIRNYGSLQTVPEEIMNHFVDASRERKLKQKDFMKLLRESGFVVLDRYPATYSRIIEGNAYMGNLESLGECLMEKLYESIEHMYQKAEMSQVKFHGESQLVTDRRCNGKIEDPLWQSIAVVGAGVCQRYFNDLMKIIYNEIPARGSQVKNQRFHMKSDKNRNSPPKGVDGCVVFVCGKPGSGKTTLSAALTMRLKYPDWTTNIQREQIKIGNKFANFRANEPDVPIIKTAHQVYTHMTRGIQAGQNNILIFQKLFLVDMLTSFIAQLIKRVECMRPGFGVPLVGNLDKDIEEYEDKLFSNNRGQSHTSKLLVQIPMFHKLLTYLGTYDPKTYYSFIVDSCDSLVPKKLDWLPEVIPQNVNFFLFCNMNDQMVKTGSNRMDSIIFSLNHLTMTERAALIRSNLAQYGKLLNESSFKNQLAKISNKRDAGLPLYLAIACDELRLNSLYQTLDKDLKSLPQTLPSLVFRTLDKLSKSFGQAYLKAALAFILLAKRPLFSTTLKRLLDKWIQLESNEDGRMPSLAFYTLLSGLQSIVCGLNDETATFDANTQQIEDHSAINKSHQGYICLRSPELYRLTMMYLKDELSEDGSEKNRIVVSRPTSSSMFKKAKCTDNLKDYDQRVFLRKIFTLLASETEDMTAEIYYLTMSGNAKKASEMLCDFGYIINRISAIGNKKHSDADIVLDFNGYIDEFKRDTALPGDEASWMEDEHSKILRDLVLRNLNFLIKQPSLLLELGYNELPRNMIKTRNTDNSFDLIDRVNDAMREIRDTSYKCYEYITWITEKENFDILDEVTIEKRHLLKHFLCICESITELQPAMKFPLESNVDQNARYITICPFNRLAAYGTANGSIILCNVETGETVDTFYGHSDEITGLKFIPLQLLPSISLENQVADKTVNVDDNLGLVLTSIAKDGYTNFWKIDTNLQQSDLYGSTGRLLKSISTKRGYFTSLDFHIRRGCLALSSTDGTVELYEVNREIRNTNTKPQHIIDNFYSYISAIQFRFGSHDYTNENQVGSDDLAIASWIGKCFIFNMKEKTERAINHVHKSAICSLSYSTDQYRQYLATLSVDGELIITNCDKYTVLSKLNSSHILGHDLKVNPSLGFGGCVHFFSMPMIDGITKENNSSTARQMILLSGAIHGAQSKLSVWDSSLGTLTSKHEITYSNGQRIVAACTDHTGKIRLLALEDKSYALQSTSSVNYQMNLLKPYSTNLPSRESMITAMTSSKTALSQDSIYFAVGSNKGDIDIFKLEKAGEFTYNLERVNLHLNSGNISKITAIRIIPVNSIVVCGYENGSVSFMNMFNANGKHCPSSKPVYEYRQASEILSIANNDGFVATASKDHSIAIWSIDTEGYKFFKILREAHPDWIVSTTFYEQNDLQFLLSGGNEGNLKCWQLGRDEVNLVSTVVAHLGPVSWIKTIQNLLITLSLDGTLRIWKCENLKMNGLTRISEMSFSNDIAMGQDMLVRLDDIRLIKSDNRMNQERVKESMKEEAENRFKHKTLTEYNTSLSEISIDLTLTSIPLEGESITKVLKFQPFMPRFESFLLGHPGTDTLSLSSHLSDNETRKIITVAGADQLDWRVFNFRDANQQKALVKTSNYEHFGPVTCMEKCRDIAGNDLIITGGADGTLIFWSRIEIMETEESEKRVFNQIWKSISQISQSEETEYGCISSIAARLTSSNMFVIYYGVGRKLCRLKVSAKDSLTKLAQLMRPININEVVNYINDPKEASLQKFCFSNTISHVEFTTRTIEETDLLIFTIDGRIHHLSQEKVTTCEITDPNKDSQLSSLCFSSVTSGASELYVKQKDLMERISFKNGVIHTRDLQYPNAKLIMPCLKYSEETNEIANIKVNNHDVLIIIDNWSTDADENSYQSIHLDFGAVVESTISCKIFSKISAANYIGSANRIKIINQEKVFCKAFVIVIATEPDGLLRVLECSAPMTSSSRRTDKVIGDDHMAKKIKRHNNNNNSSSLKINDFGQFNWQHSEWEQIGVFPSNNSVSSISSVTQELYNATYSVDLIVGMQTGKVTFFRVL